LHLGHENASPDPWSGILHRAHFTPCKIAMNGRSRPPLDNHHRPAALRSASLVSFDSEVRKRAYRNTFRHHCTDGVSVVANAAWLSLRMIGSDAPRGRKTANQLALQNPQTPAHEHWPDLARRHMLSSTGT